MKNKVGPLLNSTEVEQKTSISVPLPSVLTVPVDLAAARQSGALTATDTAAAEMQINIPEQKSFLSLDQLTMLNILASNNWKRPICFTSPYGEIGFGPYLRQEGMIFRLTPVHNAQRAMNLNKTDSLLLNTFRFGGAGLKGIYFDEENRRHLLTIRSTYAQAASNLANEGRKQEAVNLLAKAEKGISPENLPYAMVSRFQSHNQISVLYLEAAYKAGYTDLVNKVKSALRKDLTEQKRYYNYLKEHKPDSYSSFISDEQDCDQFLQYMDRLEKTYNPQSTLINEVPGQRRDSADSTH
jgi:hypothetical protein